MSRKLPPLNALRAFEAAARLASFTHAANELHVTHGAISQQIRVLEDFFQQPLLVRCRAKVSLNSAGEKLLPIIGDALDRIEKVSQHLHDDKDGETLTIHLTTAFAGRWLIPRLTDFQERHPNITIRLSPSQIFPSFREQALDVAIRWGGSDHSDLVMDKLFDVDTFAACAPSLIAGKHPLLSPENLKYHTLIHDDDGQVWAALLSQVGVDGLAQGKGLYFSDSSLALQVAVQGQGVIAAGSILAAHELESGRLVIPFRHFIEKRNAYYLYYPRRSRGEKKVQAFHQWLREKANSFAANELDLNAFVAAG